MRERLLTYLPATRSRGRRTLAATLAALALSAALPSVSSAAPLLERSDADELAQSLAEASADQDVCYGWEITVDDESGTVSQEAGSSQGPGRPLARSQCARYVVLTGGVSYTSDSSESEDSAHISLDSNLPRPPTLAQLARLGYTADSLLDEEKGDQAIVDMVGVLPLLVAESGGAPFVPFQEQRAPIPASDVPTNSPSSDWARNFWWLPLLGVVGLAALIFGFVSLLRKRQAFASPPRAVYVDWPAQAATSPATRVASPPGGEASGEWGGGVPEPTGGERGGELAGEAAGERGGEVAGEASGEAAHPAGWYADPQGETRLRYWDGERWTEHTAD